MSHFAITITRCDGCGKTDHDDRVRIVKTLNRHNWPDTATVDICEDCQSSGKFICHSCRRVHDDSHPCEAMKRKIAEGAL